MKTKLLIIICLLGGCTPLAQQSAAPGGESKVLRNNDFAYEPQVKTIVIRSAVDDPATYLYPAVTRLGDWRLMLEFDDLQRQKDNYYLTLMHCNRDWTFSGIADLDFMAEYNEFPVNNFEYSVDTHIPYTHYWINLPPVKLPGNYLAVVYRGGDKRDIILSKRFMVFDDKITFENERNLVGAGRIASLNQQINFTLSYKGLEVLNPLGNLNVTIMQNHRWDNMATDIPPSFVREIESRIEYRFFDEERMFKGGNEFRFFDLRSLTSPGRNVRSVNKTVKPFEVYIETDRSRAAEMYSQLPDYNGGFIITNLDYGSRTFTNYAFVNFTLSSRPLPGDVYVTGAFNYWNLNSENKMAYDSSRQEYYAAVLLKQGWYDYQYLVKSTTLPPYALEGTHFETENYYEILVYYRSMRPAADQLVGYLLLEKNPR